MATASTKTVNRGRNRSLGVKTWLGAGALTLGVGAALAGATAVASADTGGHSASGSASSSSSTKSDAGPKRTVAASARTVAKVTTAPSSAAVSKPAAGVKPARKTAGANASLPPINQTIDTPFGPISFVANVTAPTPPDSGPVAIDVTAKTPLGGAKFSIGGTSTFSATPTPTSTTALTDGTLQLPPAVAFAASAAGAFVGAGLSAADSLNTFVNAARSGNIAGAFVAWAAAAPKFTNALLFGTSTLDLPIPTGGTGPAIVAHIPVGGFFSPARSLSVTWDEFSTVQSGVTITLAAGDIVFAGSKFGGAAPAFLAIFGL
ncbi:hypothetical protein [Mycolicibacterium aichiense]|uniref:Uncharacterized protein n=1 Tax=Mycolicibacterium aichiense TaxID=1799 RepID=A0AAD1HSC6_9MYCO|nr:hypothetical protein [Mycolicibacterium aichiense]MCV7016147.1 hypothetical protein [Mycolicibacterium aichiense]BBX10089.1 hypothetical protein MAIC_48920 [Mycolicibacterium aichiense]STZ26245.1 Uncharacterised protein [Mycolicibacterium aichiense]